MEIKLVLSFAVIWVQFLGKQFLFMDSKQLLATSWYEVIKAAGEGNQSDIHSGLVSSDLTQRTVLKNNIVITIYFKGNTGWKVSAITLFCIPDCWDKIP